MIRNSHKNRKKASLLIAIAIAVTLLIGSLGISYTSAYFTDTDSIDNKFTVNIEQPNAQEDTENLDNAEDVSTEGDLNNNTNLPAGDEKGDTPANEINSSNNGNTTPGNDSKPMDNDAGN